MNGLFHALSMQPRSGRAAQPFREQRGLWLALPVLAAALMSPQVRAQAGNAPAAPSNVVQLSAQGVVQVKQDWMRANLSVTKEGRDAASVQSQLQKAVESAMTALRPHAQAQLMELSTGRFAVLPRYGSNGKVEGWQGQADIVLQGRDFVRISEAAAKVPEMTLSGVGFGLSRQAREQVEGEAQARAIENFRQRAATISKSFGMGSYTVREVSVNTSGGMVRPMPQMRMAGMEMAKSSMADAVPVESDNAEVTVNVSGSIQMH